ncbi:nitroreductase family protein [Halanaerobium hydrogeniformans]|uniref:Nitroreductase n=1 Tax=Halanaerobium hydrogeniformans TaxID=656519 RepID=E4RJT8_HALHG|nr:nitroreductase family protein [Halanaerobium hydrogeniformans]ADQ15508.1 nitroreductase [Halanaerobium hydrogeniformans]
MTKDIYQVIKERRSYYSINDEKVVSEEKIEEIVKYAVKHTPTAFNSQTGRVVILFDEENDKFWNIVEASLKKIVPEENFPSTKEKIDGFRSGYGTVLFYEDQSIVEKMQEEFPLYSENFPKWSEQSSGMLQYNVWNLLEAEGLGASLQHYTELIEEDVRAEWDIPVKWRFVAQMPFGKPTAEPDEKEFQPLYQRVKVYK